MKIDRFALRSLAQVTAALLFLMSLTGCKDEIKPVTNGDFAIYLFPVEILYDDSPDLTQLKFPEGPLLTADDIEGYQADDHRLTLAPGVSDRLDSMELVGYAFAVTVGNKPVYYGEFMTATMSRSSDRVVILWPPMTGDTNILEIQLGYPGPDFFSGTDPRSDQRILNSLDSEGILR